MSTRTRYFVAASLDGYIADPQGSLDWLFPFEKEDGVSAHIADFMKGVGALIMGARTYEFLIAHPGDWMYPGLTTWVFAHHSRAIPAGADVRFTSDDVAKVHAEAVRVAGERDVWMVGGGELAAQFAARGLLDELCLGVVPVVLGGGAPVLPTRLAERLQLLEITRLGGGFVELRYALGKAQSPVT